MENLAPICFVCYHRPSHTRLALAALAQASLANETEVFCFIDGPKDEDDQILVDEVERISKKSRGFATIHVIRNSAHLGLGLSVMTAVDRVLAIHKKVIVIEDDLLVSPSALVFFNDSLECFKDDESFMATCGYIFTDLRPILGVDSFFSRRGGCWGWATWRDRWALLDRDRSNILRRITEAGLKPFFEPPGCRSIIQKMTSGTDLSWSPLWYLSAAVERRLFLYPAYPLVKNIGFDNTGEHAIITDFYNVAFGPNIRIKLPKETKEHPEAERAFLKFFAREFEIRSCLGKTL